MAEVNEYRPVPVSCGKKEGDQICARTVLKRSKWLDQIYSRVCLRGGGIIHIRERKTVSRHRSRRLIISAAKNRPASFGRLVDRTILLFLAAANAVNLLIRLHQLDVIVVTSTTRARRRLDVVLSTTVRTGELGLGEVYLTCHLDIGALLLEVPASDKVIGEHLRAGCPTDAFDGAVRDSIMLMVCNVAASFGREHKTEPGSTFDCSNPTRRCNCSRGDGKEDHKQDRDEKGLGEHCDV